MTTQRTITLFHSPHTRSPGTLNLLEELGAPYELRVLNMKAGEQRQPAFLAVNPLGKVPTMLDGDTVVTEQVAIFIHLADRFQKRGPASHMNTPCGSFDAMLGDTISAADVLWGAALGWGMAFAGVPRLPVFVDYAERLGARPAAKRVEERDKSLVAEHEAALAAG